MIIGVPKEIKNQEYRVGMVPSTVHDLVFHGHEVIVEKSAGIGIGCTDKHYEKFGAKIANTAEEIFKTADMIVKVKEPQPIECKMLREGQILFTFLHLASDSKQTDLLLDSGCIAIAYETVTDNNGKLPLLAPMSEIAGRISVQVGSHYLEKPQGGEGVLLGGVPGVAAAKVAILGGGMAGTEAIRIALGMEARVTVLDKSLHCLRSLDLQFGAQLNTVYATKDSIERYVGDADLVVGAILVPGASAPKLVSKNLLKKMRKGAVMVDIAIDQGGCFETSRPTTHDDPIYVEDGIIHYCVTNMPGCVPRTSAFALNNATLPFITALADKGYMTALSQDIHLMNGLNIYKGKVTCEAVANSLGKEFVSPSTIL